jgi:2,5-diamino-6-(ribosylamino)-4(3H)-pyrimidinone 5'-phosphate reductase
MHGQARHLPPDAQAPHLPRPVILDAQLRLDPGCKLLANYARGGARRPWVLCTPSNDAYPAWQARFSALERAGATILMLPHAQDGVYGVMRLC